MSNFTQKQLERLHNIVGVCGELGVKLIAVERNQIRAAADNKSAVIVQKFKDDLFDGIEGYEVAISRVPIFTQRLNLVLSKTPDVVLEPMDNKRYYKTMRVNTKNTAFEIRFADPAMFEGEVPKGIKLPSDGTKVKFTQEHVKAISEAASAFAPEHVWVHVTPKGTRIEMFDSAAGEKISIQLTEEEEVQSTIAFRYAADVFKKIINQKRDVEAAIYSNGLMKFDYKDLDVYLLRRETDT